MIDLNSNSRLERGGFLLFLALITMALLWVAWPFALPLLWSVLAAIVFQPLYERALARLPHHPNRAALATLTLILVAVVVPAILIGSVVVEQAAALYRGVATGQFDVAVLLARLHDALPLRVQAQIDSAGLMDAGALQARAVQFGRESAGAIAGRALAIGTGAAAFVLALGVGLYTTYFLLRDGRRIGQAVLDAAPLAPGVADRLGERAVAIVRATVKGSVVVGLVQGALGAITFWIVGMPSAMLFGLLMALFSLLPAVGPAIVWAPVAVYLLATGSVWEGVVVVASGVAVIGMADNVLRPILVGRDTGIPDWMVLVTTLGGIAAMGLGGIVVGPLVAGLFLAGWTILGESREDRVRDSGP